ncbi:copper radical oxidase [Apiospora hydei]|uniref:Copper radical oxidase n=1 Tax=Apiospora hydei TaxID=1337664 RepID=A0ABR1X1Z0_9PEZI
MSSYKSALAFTALTLVTRGVHAWYSNLPSCADTYQPFTSLGCYDNAQPGALMERMDMDSGNMTTEACTARCKGNGFEYAGLLYVGTCYCGNTINTKKVDSGLCNKQCSGNSAETCGGDTSIALYKDETFPDITAQTTDAYTPMGCYTDDSNGRPVFFRQDSLSYSNLTTKACLQSCLAGGFPYAATEYAGECYCGVVLGKGVSPAGSSECNMPCNGASGEMCGGRNRQNVYWAQPLGCTQPCGYKPPVAPPSTYSVSPMPSTVPNHLRPLFAKLDMDMDMDLGLVHQLHPRTRVNNDHDCFQRSNRGTLVYSGHQHLFAPARNVRGSFDLCLQGHVWVWRLRTNRTYRSRVNVYDCLQRSGQRTIVYPVYSDRQHLFAPAGIFLIAVARSLFDPGLSERLWHLIHEPRVNFDDDCQDTLPILASIDHPRDQYHYAHAVDYTQDQHCYSQRRRVHVDRGLAPKCEFGCGKWCYTLPEFKDGKGCMDAWSHCAVNVASCYLKAGIPDALNCNGFAQWCGKIQDYCKASPAGNKDRCTKAWPRSSPPASSS